MAARRFIGVDSDGCVFDSMEVKHKECFIPAIVEHYGLAAVARWTREVAEFINLYSRHRGINRFPGLALTLRMLAERPEVSARGMTVPAPTQLEAWCAAERKLGNPALAAACAAEGTEELRRALAWSHAVNDAVDRIARNLPPFPSARKCLARLAELGAVVVVSGTPGAALEREWAEHGIDRHIQRICGQEVGSKTEMLAPVRSLPAGHGLMIGDAPGDLAAAQAVGACFFPVLPGREEASWRRLLEEGLERFANGSFQGEYQDRLLADFRAALPDEPPWPTFKGADRA